MTGETANRIKGHVNECLKHMVTELRLEVRPRFEVLKRPCQACGGDGNHHEVWVTCGNRPPYGHWEHRTCDHCGGTGEVYSHFGNLLTEIIWEA